MPDDHPDIRQLERLLRRGLLSRRQFVAGLSALGVSASGIELLIGTTPEHAHAQTAVAKYLVLIVLDAFRPDYMSLAPMPTLSALARSGISYEQAWVGQLESETPTGHATIGTGSTPRHDGVIGFEWRYPDTNREVMDGWPPEVRSGALERDMRQAGVPSIALAVKAANPKATVVSVSSEKVYAADAMGGWAADYVFYLQRSGASDTLVPSALAGHLPPPQFFQHPNLRARFPMHHFTDWDYLSTELALAAFQEFRPDVLMVNFPSADYYGHPYGGPATPAVMKAVVGGVDRNLARIVQAYKQAGIYNQTLFVITADHGMVPNDRAVDDAMTKSLVRSAGGQYFFHTGGTAAYVYLQNPQSAPQVAKAFGRAPGVEGAYALSSSKGSYTYELAQGVKLDPALQAAHQYLLNTFAGPTGPDVVAAFRENTIGTKYSSAHGQHGGLNWGAQHVPLILSGPGVRSESTSLNPARLMDVAPTVLRVLDVPSAPMDGVVLADALVDPTATEVAAQSNLAVTLTAFQDALRQQATQNIAEDVKGHFLPPPSLPLKP